MPREPESTFPIGRVVSFIVWVLVGIWAISSRQPNQPHATSPIPVYVAVGLFVLLGLVLIVSILHRIFAKPRAGIIRGV
jgi:hypothetical protein